MIAITRYTKKFVHYLRHNRAVSALEYAILIGITATAIAAGLVTFSGNVKQALTSIGSNIQAAGKAGPAVNLSTN